MTKGMNTQRVNYFIFFNKNQNKLKSTCSNLIVFVKFVTHLTVRVNETILASIRNFWIYMAAARV